MSTTERIELRRTRDFGATVNVVFEFMRQNWRALGRSMLYIMLPVLILSTVLTGVYVTRFFSMMPTPGADETPPMPSDIFGMYGGIAPMMALSALAFVVALIFMFGVVAGYVRLYEERYPEPIELDDVWREVRRSFWRITSTIVVCTIVTIVPAVVLVLPAIATQTWWAIPLGVFIAMFPILYLTTVMSITVPMRLEEEIGIFNAIGRSMRLMKGRWWFTFWLIVVMQIILMIASTIFQLPLQALVMFQAYSGEMQPGILLYLAVALGVIGNYLLYSFLILTCSVQYYNLVEQKEGVGMAERIEEIGSVDA